MPDVSKVVMENSKIAAGAVGGSLIMGIIRDQLKERDISVVENYPEVLHGGFAAAGLALRFSGKIPKEVNSVGDGLVVAGLIGLVDDLYSRFFGKDLSISA